MKSLPQLNYKVAYEILLSKYPEFTKPYLPFPSSKYNLFIEYGYWSQEYIKFAMDVGENFGFPNLYLFCYYLEEQNRLKEFINKIYDIVAKNNKGND